MLTNRSRTKSLHLEADLNLIQVCSCRSVKSMASQSIPAQGLNSSDNKAASAHAHRRSRETVLLSVSVSDDGERCSARISVEQEDAADDEIHQNSSIDHVAAGAGFQDEIKHFINAGEAFETTETQKCSPASPNSLLQAKQNSMDPWGSAEPAETAKLGDSSQESNGSPTGRSPYASQLKREVGQAESLTMAGSPECDPESKQDAQGSAHDRYDGSASSRAESSNDPAEEQHPPCSLHMTPRVEQSPGR